MMTAAKELADLMERRNVPDLRARFSAEDQRGRDQFLAFIGRTSGVDVIDVAPATTEQDRREGVGRALLQFTFRDFAGRDKGSIEVVFRLQGVAAGSRLSVARIGNKTGY